MARSTSKYVLFTRPNDPQVSSNYTFTPPDGAYKSAFHCDFLQTYPSPLKQTTCNPGDARVASSDHLATASECTPPGRTIICVFCVCHHPIFSASVYTVGIRGMLFSCRVTDTRALYYRCSAVAVLYCIASCILLCAYLSARDLETVKQLWHYSTVCCSSLTTAISKDVVPMTPARQRRSNYFEKHHLHRQA